MQDEDLAPSDVFLHELGTFLKVRGIKPPFVVPVVETKRVQQTNVEAERRKLPQLFRQFMKSSNLDGALALYESSRENLTVTDLSALIEKLVQNNRLADAAEVTINMLNAGLVPSIKVFRFILNKLSGAGMAETIEKMAPKIDPQLKKLVSFDNKLCHANVTAGRSIDILNRLESRIDSAPDSELRKLEEEFPRGGSVAILEKSPELVDKFKTLAVKYSERNITGPINVLWCHHFINNNEAEAESIWNQHLSQCPRVMFQRIVSIARANKDLELVEKLVKHLKKGTVSEGALGNVYSCLLDVLVLREEYEKVISTFESVLKEVPITAVNRTAVVRVKEVYDKLEKPFNYRIPAKSASKSSGTSLSSSDEEENRKK